jgi:hypothetical protein
MSLPTWWREENVNNIVAPGVDIPTNVCSLLFEIPKDIGPPVFLYYRLTNFYQNHRRYVKSLDLDQLKGKALSNNTIRGSSCDPLRINPDNGKAYYPCGLIANSLFNDTFESPLRVAGGEANSSYFMTNKGISWVSDKELYKPTQYSPDQISPPPNWQKRYPKGYTHDNPPPNLQEDEAFQVWMRTAGLPTFSKLARRNDNETMVKGTYLINIYDCKIRTIPQCYVNAIPLLIFRISFSRYSLWGNQVCSYLNEDRDGWQEPVHGYRVCCCWRDLHCSWCPFHGCTFD